MSMMMLVMMTMMKEEAVCLDFGELALLLMGTYCKP
jgi:hypothetical protein